MGIRLAEFVVERLRQSSRQARLRYLSDVFIKWVDDVIAKAKEAEVKLHQAADTARKTAATAAFFTAFSMLIGAFIAAVAATIAGYRRNESLALRTA
jgi:hypothetical protein